MLGSGTRTRDGVPCSRPSRDGCAVCPAPSQPRALSTPRQPTRQEVGVPPAKPVGLQALYQPPQLLAIHDLAGPGRKTSVVAELRTEQRMGWKGSGKRCAVLNCSLRHVGASGMSCICSRTMENGQAVCAGKASRGAGRTVRFAWRRVLSSAACASTLTAAAGC